MDAHTEEPLHDHPPMLLTWRRVPRSSALVWAVLAHLAILPLFITFRPKNAVHIVPQQYASVQMITGPANHHLVFNTPQAEPHPARLHLRRRVRQPQVAQAGNAQQNSPGEVLRRKAARTSAAMVSSLNFRAIYGFVPGHQYQFAGRTQGEVPPITAAQLPPRFEQYVIAEVTIDVDGSVADARIVTGVVPPEIEQTLLTAIRKFRYIPAKRDDMPIPSQLDIVVRIPNA
jgi:TonB family protein